MNSSQMREIYVLRELRMKMHKITRPGIVWILLLGLAMSFLSIQSVWADEVPHYTLYGATEYMDGTYVFLLDDMKTQVVCGEYNVPTFDPKHGLIDWIDLYETTLETIYETDRAEHIRAIVNFAGLQHDEEQIVNLIEERLGIMDVTYEQWVSAMQYALWYYSDDLTRVPSSENGEDIYRYLISLPPVPYEPIADAIHLEQPVVIDEEENLIEVNYEYWSEDPGTVSHFYDIDIASIYGARENVLEEEGHTVVTLTIPIKNVETIEFTVYVDGTTLKQPDVYAYVPQIRGTLQAMIGYMALEKEVPLTHKQQNFIYESTNSEESTGPGGGTNPDEDTNPDDNDNPDDGTNPGGSDNPDGGTNPGGNDNPGDDTDPSDNSNPDNGTDPENHDNPEIDHNGPDGIDEPEGGDLIEEILPDDIPEGIPSLDPFDEDGLPSDPEIDDDSIPQASPELSSSGHPVDLGDEGTIHYMINRFVQSGGVPFIIFMFMGIVALGLGTYLRQKSREDAGEDIEELEKQ